MLPLTSVSIRTRLFGDRTVVIYNIFNEKESFINILCSARERSNEGSRREGVRCYRNLSALFLYNRTDMYADELSGALLSLWLKQWPEKALSDVDICTACSNVRSRYRDQIIKENQPLDSLYSRNSQYLFYFYFRVVLFSVVAFMVIITSYFLELRLLL